MPTPAVDINEVFGGSSAIWKNGNFLGDFPMLGCYAARRQRPESVSNPVRADHTRAPGNWSHLGGRLESEVGVVNRYSSSNSWRISGHLFGGLTPDIPAINRADVLLDRARIKALGTFTERTASMNEALSQVAGTSKMVHDFSRIAAEGLNDLMTKNWRRIGRNMSQWKKLPSQYLEYCYGLAPLGDDISNAVEVLSDKHLRGFEMALTLESTLGERTEFLSGLKRGSQGYYYVKALYDENRYVKCRYTYALPSWYFDRLPTTAPFSSNYAMMPWSFIIDWVYPIGDWLLALEAAQLAPFFKEGSETRFITRELKSVEWQPSATTTVDRVSGGLKGHAFHMVRQRCSEVPTALTALPSLKNPLGLTKVAQGLSLLTQVFRKWA